MSRSLVTRPDITRISVGWAAYAAVLGLHPVLRPPAPAPVLVIGLLGIVAVIVLCAFGVVKQAEALAHRLGDPYGSLVLTLSIVIIEVVLISAVMIGPGDHATIARDSVMAVSMIVLNLVVGVCLLVSGIRHGALAHNRAGTSAYMAMITVFTGLAFAVPALIGRGGAFTPAQWFPVVILTLAAYGFFLFRQLGAQAADFQEVTAIATQPSAAVTEAAVVPLREELTVRLTVLLATAIPIVLLSHDMAALLDDGLGRLGAPAALSGLLIAMIVFLPESITAVRAAYAGEIQRVSNLAHGALVSTVCLTIPAVLVIGALTGQQVTLAESPMNLLLLALTLIVSISTFASRRVTAIHGAVLLVLFALYALALLS